MHPARRILVARLTIVVAINGHKRRAKQLHTPTQRAHDEAWVRAVPDDVAGNNHDVGMEGAKARPDHGPKRRRVGMDI